MPLHFPPNKSRFPDRVTENRSGRSESPNTMALGMTPYPFGISFMISLAGINIIVPGLTPKRNQDMTRCFFLFGQANGGDGSDVEGQIIGNHAIAENDPTFGHGRF